MTGDSLDNVNPRTYEVSATRKVKKMNGKLR